MFCKYRPTITREPFETESIRSGVNGRFCVERELRSPAENRGVDTRWLKDPQLSERTTRSNKDLTRSLQTEIEPGSAPTAMQSFFKSSIFQPQPTSC